MKRNREKIWMHISDKNPDLNFIWFKDLPKEIINWAISEIDQMVSESGLEYDDNYRVCEVGEIDQEEAYMKISMNGCCGSCQFQKKGPDNKLYLIGFNYGH